MAESQAKLPDTMLWSCYDVGSTGYIHASAMADALLKKQGTKIRLTPSGTSIGRLMPLKAKRVDVGWLATEAFFAAEGTYDFASYDWGPQDVRTFLAFPTAHAVIVTKESGIKTLKDLKGKKVSWIPGNPSLNVKMTAYLAFAGLTWDDVVKVDFANYGATMKGIIEGKVDAVCGTATAGLAYELASTPRGISYPPFPPDDKEAWKRMLKVAPFLTPYKETVGAGLSEENAVQLVQYRYPVGTVYADADPEMVYNLVKALDQTFPLYEKSAPKMEWWAIDKAGVPPADAPFHDGAIRYLKERGVWTAEHQAWNDKGVARIQELRKLWDKLVPEAKAKSMNDEAFADFWMKEQTKVE
jgi:TRAP transporter TAXI family solute receptor